MCLLFRTSKNDVVEYVIDDGRAKSGEPNVVLRLESLFRLVKAVADDRNEHVKQHEDDELLTSKRREEVIKEEAIREEAIKGEVIREEVRREEVIIEEVIREVKEEVIRE